MSGLPNGTVTFVFSDIEGSTRLIRQLGQSYVDLLADHRRLISDAYGAEGGQLFGSEGDALFAAFSSAAGAVRATAAAQRALAAHDWQAATQVRVRMGVHTGEAQLVDGPDYVGLTLHEVARVTDAGHGGQVLVSATTRQLLGGELAGLSLRDLGEHRLKDLAERVHLYQLCGEGLASEFPPPRTLDQRPNNLPVLLTSFVERAELRQAREALGRSRLLTLTGPGGTGKTRLALELAAASLAEYPDGTWFVALEAVTDAQLVPAVIGSTIGFSQAADRTPLEALADHLRDKQVLLVLDNFEQVVDAGPMVAQLLRDAPGVRAVVTSRVVLRVHGEHEFQVPTLSLPDPGALRGDAVDVASVAASEAARLFIERARAVQPSFVLDERNAAAVAEIVGRLDGLPLAIELAAARLRVLPVEAIRTRLDQRLSLLTGGARDLPARQQTLRGAIDWSYELLDEAERILLERFSAFAGGAFLAEAELVCRAAADNEPDVLDGLSALADKSLLRAVSSEQAEPRFAMLASIRDYAAERLAQRGTADETRQRHADAYAARVESCAAMLIQADGAPLQDRLETDHDNLRAALEWCVANGLTAHAMGMVAGLWRFWQARGHLHEARRWIERVLAMPAVAEQPAELRARTYAAAGGIAYWQGDFVAAHPLYRRQLEAARETGERALVAEATYNLGFAALPEDSGTQDERYRAGRPWFEQALAAYTELGDETGIANAEWALALSAAAHKDLEAARDHGLRALEAYRARNDVFGVGWAAHMLALYSLATGRPDEAIAFALESLDTFDASRDVSGRLLAAYDVALVITRHGRREDSLRMSAAVDRLRQTTGVGVIGEGFEHLEWNAPEEPSDEAGRRTWAEGAAWDLDQLVDYARQAAAQLKDLDGS